MNLNSENCLTNQNFKNSRQRKIIHSQNKNNSVLLSFVSTFKNKLIELGKLQRIQEGQPVNDKRKLIDIIKEENNVHWIEIWINQNDVDTLYKNILFKNAFGNAFIKHTEPRARDNNICLGIHLENKNVFFITHNSIESGKYHVVKGN